jgi:hypothetical protein
MVKSCVFFEVGTKFLNVIFTSYGFKGLKKIFYMPKRSRTTAIVKKKITFYQNCVADLLITL